LKDFFFGSVWWQGIPAGNESKFANFQTKRGDKDLQKTHILCSFQDFDSHLALNSTALHVTIMAASSGTQGD
jgi:hypothetical protein